MTLRPLLLCIALTAAIAAPQASAAAKKKPAARKAASPAAATACTDFYSFVHKDWLLANPVAPASGMMSAMGQLQERSVQQQIDLLNGAMQAQGGVSKLLGDFWASGLDENAVEADGSNSIAPLLGRINSIKRSRDIPPAIAALHQVGIPVAFNFGADIDLNDLSRHIGYFSQGGLGLPDPAFYTRTDAEARTVFTRYRDYVRKMLALTGTPAATLDAETAAVVDLETRIAQASRPLSQLQDPAANYAPVPTAPLARQFPRLQLGDFLKEQAVKDDVVSMANPALFAQLDTLVGGLPVDAWKAYLRFRVGDAMAPYLSRSFRDAEFDFRGRVLRGDAGPGTRQKQVLDAINLAAGPMLGREYVGRYLPAATRARAEDIAGKVRDALGRSLDGNSWMSPAAKAEAKAKLGKLRIEVGAPRRDLDYSIQPMGRGSFGANMLIASTWRHREEMKRIGRGNADRRWPVLPQQPALAYDIAQNRLIVSAAVLQAPVLDMFADPAAQFGSYGALVGHELTHGFDGRGRAVDAAGKVRDWWTPADVVGWETRAAQLSAQFGAYPYPLLPNVRVNGSQTREENLGDLSGVELATQALDAAPGQSFYTAWARLWPQQMSEAAAALLSSTDVHAPGKWRTNGPLANQSGFGSAYACKPGTPMQRPAAEQIVLWR